MISFIDFIGFVSFISFFYPFQDVQACYYSFVYTHEIWWWNSLLRSGQVFLSPYVLSRTYSLTKQKIYILLHGILFRNSLNPRLLNGSFLRWRLGRSCPPEGPQLSSQEQQRRWLCEPLGSARNHRKKALRTSQKKAVSLVQPIPNKMVCLHGIMMFYVP